MKTNQVGKHIPSSERCDQVGHRAMNGARGQAGEPDLRNKKY